MFGSGFLALAGWTSYLVWRRVREGLRGFAAVPWGYRSAVVAVGGFVVSGLADIVWHARFGEARGIAIVFAPGHLGLTVSMLVLVTAPLRSAIGRVDIGDAPPLRLLWPALLTTGLAASLVMAFLDYGNAITYSANRIVDALSATDDDAPVRELAAAVLITATILLTPLLFLARRWRLPFGAATLTTLPVVALSATQTHAHNRAVLLPFTLAAPALDLLILTLDPTPTRPTTYRTFALTTCPSTSPSPPPP